MARQQIKTLNSIAGLPLEKQLKAIKLLVDGGQMSRRARRAARRILADIQSNETAAPELRQHALELYDRIPSPETAVPRRSILSGQAGNGRNGTPARERSARWGCMGRGRFAEEEDEVDPLVRLKEHLKAEARSQIIPVSGTKSVKPWPDGVRNPGLVPPAVSRCNLCGEDAECCWSGSASVEGWRCVDCFSKLSPLPEWLVDMQAWQRSHSGYGTASVAADSH